MAKEHFERLQNLKINEVKEFLKKDIVQTRCEHVEELEENQSMVKHSLQA